MGATPIKEVARMKVVVVGTGSVAGVLGRALAAGGYDVAFGSRHPESDDVAGTTRARVLPVGDAVGQADAIILALPGNAVPDLVAEHGAALAGKLVIDATNKIRGPVSNARAALPPDVRYARAFNTVGVENMAEPVFADGQRADMFFSSPEADREAMEALISTIGLRPVYVGEDQEAVLDGMFHLWVSLASNQGRGRRLAFKLLEG